MNPIKVRIKEVPIEDGETFRIGSLTLDQVDEATVTDELKTVNDWQQHMKKVLSMSLNNALPEGASDEERWTPARISAELDLFTFETLHQEVLRHSRMRVVERTTGTTPGESNAVSTTPAGTSPKSEAASLQ